MRFDLSTYATLKTVLSLLLLLSLALGKIKGDSSEERVYYSVLKK